MCEKARQAKKGKSALKSGAREELEAGGESKLHPKLKGKQKKESIKKIFRKHARANLFQKLPTEGGQKGWGRGTHWRNQSEGRKGEKTGCKLNQTRHSKSLLHFLFH